jgi:hypothetical protein
MTRVAIGLTLTFMFSALAQAQNYPWVRLLQRHQQCGFVSYEQCMADASGNGGFCQLNSSYVPTSGPDVRRAPRRAPSH